MRKDRRAPASLKVKYKSATVDEFIEQFGSDVSRGGIFIKTKKPLETGALLKFEFQLSGGVPVIHGVGRVAWRRAEAQARADLPAGMGIKFIKLAESSRAVIDRIESRHGVGSRFDQTEAAEMAAPLSSLPPGPAGLTPPPAPRPSPHPIDTHGRPTPLVPGPPLGSMSSVRAANPAALQPPAAPRSASLGTAAAPRGLGMSPARSNGPKPAPAAPPTFRPPPPAVSSIPPALADGWRSAPPHQSSPAPKGALGGVSPSRKAVPSTRSAARDTSEFLASAFSVGGAGAEVRSQAQAQVERARRDPQSVDLANELFGDLSEPAHVRAPVAPDADGLADVPDLSALEQSPLRSISSDPKPPSPEERSLAEQIPSLEDLENEPAQPSAGARRSNGADGPARSNGAEASPAMLAATASKAARGPAPANDARPLSLDLSLASASPAANGGKASSMITALVLGAVLCAVVAAGAFYMLRGRNAPPPAPPPSPAAAAEPVAPPPSAAAAPGAAREPTNVAMQVTSEPAGASVSIDGKAVGATPVTVDLPAQTAVEVRVHSPGFEPKTEKVTPSTGMRPLHVALAPLTYELTIVSEPKGALVKAGEASAESPNPLVLGHVTGRGPIEVMVEKDGFQRMSRSVRLDEFEERDGKMRAELTLSLMPSPPARRRAAAPPPPAAARTKAPTEAPPAPSANDVPEPSEAPPVMQVKPAEQAAEAAPKLAPAPEANAAPPPPVLQRPRPLLSPRRRPSPRRASLQRRPCRRRREADRGAGRTRARGPAFR